MNPNLLADSLQLSVDLHQVDLPQRAGVLAQMFEQLKPDEGFVMISDADPREHLGPLLQLHRDQVHWIPIYVRPDHWRVAVFRRNRRLSGFQRIQDFMVDEHRKMALLVLYVQELAAQDDWPAAHRAAAYLETCLSRHVRMEEEVLMPMLRRVTGDQEVLCNEGLCGDHEQVLGLVRGVRDATQSVMAQPGGTAVVEREIRELAEQLRRTFARHVCKEERTLYALVDIVLDTEEVDALMARLQAVTVVSRMMEPEPDQPAETVSA